MVFLPLQVLVQSAVIAVALFSHFAVAFPQHASLAGLSERDFHFAMTKLKAVVPASPPGPLRFDGSKLVFDKKHPWEAPRRGDLRGACPGLNTLASHGYLPRNGVATPSQIITAVQEAFNMENKLARFTTYFAMILDGNLVTDLISIGGKTPLTGVDPPLPAIVGGMTNHGTFEGDASVTRADSFFGDNHSFNQTLFDQFKDFSEEYGNGFYNMTVAGELRFHRIQQSIAQNPQFNLAGLRHLTAYAEVTFPANFFVDGRKQGSEIGQLDMKTAESFFKDMRFPKGFHRAAKPFEVDGIDVVFSAHPVLPGKNNGEEVDTFTVDESLGSLLDRCKLYTEYVNTTVRSLYPNPTGVLRRNLELNLQFLFDALSDFECTQVFL
ncbi:Cloroperoxidase [Coprinopsis marcescibilis]|uniref:Cloroperoxidase n=1 Tax=Coprinopsis marcescibilis TaxID=230819 RepID=A0A5C3KXC1_COPMA|nr:Cloroperoxidase [Coprinopsis marcescibilis]